MNYLTSLLSKCLNCCCSCYQSYSYKWIDRPYINVDTLEHKEMKLINTTCMSSHNSTIDDLQIMGPSHVNILKETLNMGFRMIELDIFHKHHTDIPVVSHGKQKYNLQVTSSVLFETCCDVIQKYGWKDTNLPLFMNLEINTANKRALINLETILFKKFHTRILVQDNKMLKDYTLSELKNKLIIMPNKPLKYMANYKLQNHSENINPDRIDAGELSRIYPSNIILSKNLNFNKFTNCNFVCMNVSYKDEYLRDYLKYFQSRGIIPILKTTI